MKISILDEKNSEIMCHIELLHRKIDMILERLNMDLSDSDSDECDEVIEKPKNKCKVINLTTLKPDNEENDVSVSSASHD